jgi:hypothetical protein
MVKFGVPNPVATWASAAGIPSRRVGIELADKYLAETDSPNFTDFLGWITRLDAETLRFELGLRSPILEDVSRALSRTGVNPVLKEHASIVECLPLETYVLGISYENRSSVAMGARKGEAVKLVRDYDNLIDRNAVKVLFKGQDLGYLERQPAQLAAPDIDCGVLLRGNIIEIEKGRIPQIKIRIELEEQPTILT